MAEILYGLETAEYRHPADIAALKALEKAMPLNKLAESMEEYQRKYRDEIIFKGSYVRLNERNAPRVIALFNKAMEVLDCNVDVEIYSYRSYSFRMAVGGINRCVLQIPDAVLRRLNDDQLLFMFGQMVTMIRGRMLKLFAIAKGIHNFTSMFPQIGAVIESPLGQWKRKAQLTIDRGGLLASQNYDSAMRYLTILSGINPEEVEKIDLSARIEQLIYSNAEEKGIASTIGKVTQTALGFRDSWANERFIELYNWYESGEYGKIIANHT